MGEAEKVSTHSTVPMNEKESSYRDILTIFAHVGTWGAILFFPYLMVMRGGANVSFYDYFSRVIPYYIIYLSFFYLNNGLLVPRFLLKQRYWIYLLLIALTIWTCATLTGILHQIEFQNTMRAWSENAPYELRNSMRDFHAPFWAFRGSDFFMMTLIAAFTDAVRIVSAWNKSENSRREAEKQRMESELAQLRNQLNPHFLLNTLNNIYALIAFDSDKAQESVQELSQLLRHVLYENKENYTTLEKEMQFMKSYIELMRIRLASNVKIETTYDMRENDQTPIAPLIFISLVENAFKHGVSPTEPSYINIYFSEKLGYVRCEIKNSNHRKVGYDQSGSGIGLEQVQKRLDLMYPGSYVWHYGLSDDGKEYISSLEINTKNALFLD